MTISLLPLTEDRVYGPVTTFGNGSMNLQFDSLM